MPPFIVSARQSGRGNGVPYIETAMNRRSRVLKPPTSLGQNAIQKITFAPAVQSGVFDLVFGGYTTSDINAATANYSTIQTALEALTSIGSGNILVTGDWTGYYCEFQGSLANTAEANMTVVNNSLVAADNAISVTTTTPPAGVFAIFQLNFTQGDGSGSFVIEIAAQNGPYHIPVTSADSAATVQASINSAVYQIGNATVVDNGSGGTPYTISFLSSFSTGGVSLSVDGDVPGDDSDPNPSVAQVSQVDTITLDSNVSGGTWHIGSQIGIPYNAATTAIQDSWQLTFTPGSGANTFSLDIDGNNLPCADNSTGASIYATMGIYGINADIYDADGNMDGAATGAQPFTIVFSDSTEHALSINFDTGAGAAAVELNPYYPLGVRSAIENYLSISGGTLTPVSQGINQYTYGTPGNNSANTTLLAANTAGDTLTQAVTVSVTTTQVGG